MIALAILCALALPQDGGEPGGFAGTPAGKHPVVEIAWNRLYDIDELYALMDRIEAAHPGLLSHQVIGHSVENREMRVYTLNQPTTGRDVEKPAMWIDGNVHGNEVQGGEAVAYVAWWARRTRRLPDAPDAAAVDADVGARASVRQRLVLALLVAGLGAVTVGSLRYGWGIVELAALFVGLAVVCGLAGGLGADGTAEYGRRR